MHPEPKLILVLAGGLAAGLALYPTHALVADTPADSDITEDARRPISYFNASCGNCHGDYGSFWGEGFAAELSDKELHEIVDEMAAGPAQAPLEGVELEVQVAYHRSLVDKKPFVVAWKDDDGTWQGEVTPGSTIRLNGEETGVVEGHRWQGATDTGSLRVENEGRETVLSLTGGETGIVFSHSGEANASAGSPASQPASRPATQPASRPVK